MYVWSVSFLKSRTCTLMLHSKFVNHLLSCSVFMYSSNLVKVLSRFHSFAIMSGKHKQDYIGVFSATKIFLPVVNVKSDENTHTYTCKLLSLPYLAPEHIDPIFEKLQEKVVTQPLQELTSYIASTGLGNPLWPSLSWSVFGRVICSNNDVEGWHHCLNQKAKKGQLPFYLLVHLLHEETKWINIQVHLVLEYKITCRKERWYRMVQSRVLSIWDDYTYGKYLPHNYSMPVQSWYMFLNKSMDSNSD